MIEAIMFFVLGFLAASLLALLVLPAVWRRAVRLTTKRIEGAIPVSIAEIQADKDQFRAGYAMQTRKLELNINTLTEQTARQSGELALRAEAIRALETQTRERAAQLEEFERSSIALNEELRVTGEDLAGRRQALEETGARLAAREAELEAALGQLDEQTSIAQSRHIDVIALTTQRDMLKDRVAELDRDLAATRTQLEETRAVLADTVTRHANERGRADGLDASLVEAQAALAETRARAETLARDLVTCETELGRLDVVLAANAATLTQHAGEIERLAGEGASLRESADAAARRSSETIEMLRAEKAMMEDALVQVREERGRLQALLGTLGTSERAPVPAEAAGEDAFLRERISDVAAEVARLTAALEGPASPINGLVAANGAGGDWHDASHPSLADRIRALQSRAPVHGNAAE